MMAEHSIKFYSDSRRHPELTGFEEDNGEWQLELNYYRNFISDVTGVELTCELSRREMKTIQNYLEGCVETYTRTGSCMCDKLERYEYIDSINTVHELSRFFRVLVSAHDEGTIKDSKSLS